MSEDIDIVELIKKLKPVKFKYKGQDKNTFGFIAQDLLDLFPENEYTMVEKDKDGYYFVDTNQLVPLLCLCIQKLIDERG